MDAMNLHHFIWSRMASLSRFRYGSDKATASNFVHILEEVHRKRWKRLIGRRKYT
jgi:hypothetical protein